MKPIINALFAVAAFVAPACAIFEPRWEVVAPSMQPVWFQVPQFVIDHEEREHCIEGKNHD